MSDLGAGGGDGIPKFFLFFSVILVIIFCTKNIKKCYETYDIISASLKLSNRRFHLFTGHMRRLRIRLTSLGFTHKNNMQVILLTWLSGERVIVGDHVEEGVQRRCLVPPIASSSSFSMLTSSSSSSSSFALVPGTVHACNVECCHQSFCLSSRWGRMISMLAL